MVLQLGRVLACSVVGSDRSWVSLDRKQQRGQDTSRKVRPVGWGRKSSKTKQRPHLAARGHKLAIPGNRRKRSGFHTLRLPA
jgi:hypothetical protein